MSEEKKELSGSASVKNETIPVVKKPVKNFLENKVIIVKPVQAGGRWAELLVKGEEMKDEPFMFEKIKRSYQVPLRPRAQGGGLHRVLDNTHKFETPQYPGERLTEEEFFERELSADLNPLLPKEQNFWRIDKRARVTMDKRGLTLQLSNIMDMLRYKILKSNKRKIAPSPELANTRASYEFLLLDKSLQTIKVAEKADLEVKAALRFAEISQSNKTMRDFMKVQGKAVPTNADPNWLKAEIYKVVKQSPTTFLNYADDPYYNDKILIADGLSVGVLKRVKDNHYCLDNGADIGTMTDLITYLNIPENQVIRMKIEELYKLRNS